MSFAPTGRYRPDIDGLRAIAILGVVIFHLDERLLAGGFLGVDVFFVISGFLITGIIRRRMAAGGFSFAEFFERRIRRLMPALFVLIALVSIPCLIWMWPADLKQYAVSVKYVVLPLANVHFLDVLGDYFNEGASQAILLHAWSLAVEEQFYLIFPAVLLLLNRIGKRKVDIACLWLAGATSLGLCVWRGMSDPMECFFLLPYRAWELLAGVLLAVHSPKPPRPAVASPLAWAGLALIIASFFLARGAEFAPGFSAVPVCLGAVMLIHSGSAATGLPMRLLTARPMVWLGLVSYSLYLWHWPLIVFWKMRFGKVDFAGGALLFAASVLFGWLSWKWVEQPFRTPIPGRRIRVFATWAAVAVAMLLARQLVRNMDGLPGRFPEDVRRILGFQEKEDKYSVDTEDGYDPGRAPVFGDKSVAPTIALWGDSHAESLLPALDRMATERNVSFRIYPSSGQIPVPSMTRKGKSAKERERYSAEVMDLLLRDSSITTVVLHARWAVALYPKGGDDGIPEFYGRNLRTMDEVLKAYEAGLTDVVSRFLEKGKRVVLIYPVPEPWVTVPRLLARERHEGMPLTQTIPCPDFGRRNSKVMSWLDSMSAPEGQLIRIKPHLFLLQDGMVRVSDGERPFYRDSHHLSAPGAEYISDLLIPVFRETPEP